MVKNDKVLGLPRFFDCKSIVLGYAVTVAGVLGFALLSNELKLIKGARMRTGYLLHGGIMLN